MHCPLCQHKFTFCQSALVVNPFRTPCPSCKGDLALGRHGTRYALAALIGGATVAAVSIKLAESGALTGCQALVAFAMTFSLATGFGEWVFWKYGNLKPAAPK